MNVGHISFIHDNHSGETAFATSTFMFQQVASVGLPPHNLARATSSQAFGSRFTGFQLRHGSLKNQHSLLSYNHSPSNHNSVIRFFSAERCTTSELLGYTDRVPAGNRGTSRLEEAIKPSSASKRSFFYKETAVLDLGKV